MGLWSLSPSSGRIGVEAAPQEIVVENFDSIRKLGGLCAEKLWPKKRGGFA